MIRKTSLTIAICFLLAATLTTPVLAAKDYHAENFEVLVDIQPDGSLLVTETVTFRFDGGPFTYVFREISRTGTDDIQVLDASMDGVILQPGEGTGQVEIIDDDPVSVTWHFEPTSDSTHVFVITYRVDGAIRHDEAADTLFWAAIPVDHDYTISQGLIRIVYPEHLMPLDDPVLDGVTSDQELGAGTVTFNTQEISPDGAVNVSIRFPSGSLVSQAPGWQVEQEQQAQEDARVAQALPFGLGAAALTGIFGLAIVVLMGLGFRREDHAATPSTHNFTMPPGPVAPALAARLIQSGTAFLGTLFDLGQRGVLRIEDGPKKWGGRTFELIRQPSNEKLNSHEQAFVQALFRKAKDDRVALTEIASLAYAREYNQAVDAEINAAGWRDAERIQKRSRYLLVTGLGFVAGIAMFFLGLLLGGVSLFPGPWAMTIGFILMGSGVGLGGAGTIGLIVAASISTLSSEGIRQKEAWNSFTGYLRNITRGREPAVAPEFFERYLPYAAGFGIATEWAKFFQKMADIPIPAWFQGLQSSMDDGSFVTIMAAISAADTSASVASGADGGGASVGGASGAG